MNKLKKGPPRSMKNGQKKKHFRMLDNVKDFMRQQTPEVKKELNHIIWRLERDGILLMPYGEKVIGEDLFAIRVVNAGNIRVFFMYMVSMI